MHARTNSIDIALATMAADREPGRCYSCIEIAEACGCDSGTVRNIEQQALAKLRIRLKKVGLDKEVAGA